jgi:hypothetical protein
MTVKEAFTTVGGCSIYALILLAVAAVVIAFLYGGVAIAPVILPWLFLISAVVFVLCLVVILPLAIFRPLRPWSGLAIYIASYLFGITCWFSGLLITWSTWGGIAVIIGLLFMGIGVVPIAIVASLFKAMWGNLIFMIVMVVVTFGTRIVGTMLATSEESEY